MTEPINLNRARKAKVRADGMTKAAQNRVRFGRTKAEKDAERLRAEQVRRTLDGAKRDD